MRITLRLFTVSSELAKSVKMYAQFKPICLSMQQLLDFGAKRHPPKDSFIFLQKELPVRLANIMEEMSLLPPVLLEARSVVQIRKWYDLTFKEILEFSQLDPDKPKVLERFMTTLKNVKSRHSSVVETMAEGVTEMRRELATCPELLNPKGRGPIDESTMLKMTSTFSESETLNESVHYFLNRFYMNRIGLNMLIETHLSLFSKSEDDIGQEEPSNESSSSDDDDDDDKIHHLIGCLDPKCDVMLIAENAFQDAQDLCWKHYGSNVNCNFTSYNKMNGGKKIRMTYVPSHLYHMLFELFKNALKTMIDRYEKEDSDIPNIECLISRGQEDIIIKVSDRGKGIARSDLSNIFQFQCSSSLPPPSPNDENFTLSPLSGYGYGLPLSRLYARYFSGDLWLNSIEGFGTDAMIALKADPSEAMEVLPLMTKTASDHYSSHLQVGDWSDSKHFKRNNFIHE